MSPVRFKKVQKIISVQTAKRAPRGRDHRDDSDDSDDERRRYRPKRKHVCESDSFDFSDEDDRKYRPKQTTTQTHRDFTDEPMDGKPVSELFGIGPRSAAKLDNEGIRKVN